MNIKIKACRKISAASTPSYYCYALNSRGDVIGLYNSSGALIVNYKYDAYGKLLSITNSSGSAITAKYSYGVLNPLRYRGYVYDTETGLYYLQSRYYDPTTCRFVNEDNPSNMGIGTINSYNLFSYCSNNPVNGYDPTGQWDWGVALDFGVTLFATGAAISVGFITFVTSLPKHSLLGSAARGVSAGAATYGVINNTVNAVYYNYISDTSVEDKPTLEQNADLGYSTYTEEYVPRWDILDHTKVMTKEPTYNINAWRYKSEYSIHMYGWYATSWADEKNIPVFSATAQRSKHAHVETHSLDTHFSINVGTFICGIFGL